MIQSVVGDLEMDRLEIVDRVGREYCTSNIEKGEFRYPKAFKEKNLEFEPIKRARGGVIALGSL